MRDDLSSSRRQARHGRSSDAPDSSTPATEIGLDERFDVVYGELKRLAHRQLRAEAPGHTLSTTALVHEAYLKLSRENEQTWSNREQFFALAARAMRRVLIDYARRRRALRRGGGEQHRLVEPLRIGTEWPEDATAAVADDRADEMLALDEALDRLAQLDPRLARVVELRFFAGLTADETAKVLGVVERTVIRDWIKARAYLVTLLDPKADAG
jgi:RNA polymerase sigma factor (TIGR02999 family)